jgi:hypothetical protein
MLGISWWISKPRNTGHVGQFLGIVPEKMAVSTYIESDFFGMTERIPFKYLPIVSLQI